MWSWRWSSYHSSPRKSLDGQHESELVVDVMFAGLLGSIADGARIAVAAVVVVGSLRPDQPVGGKS